MKSNRRFSVTFASVIAAWLAAPPANAQISQSTVTSLPMPPPQGFNLIRDLSGLPFETTFSDVVHDYAVNATNQNAQDPLNVAYISVTATPGTNAVILPEWPNWGPDAIPDPVNGTDGCAHAHFGYAIYEKVNFFLFVPFAGWVPGGSYFSVVQTQGELGRRYDSNGEVDYGLPGTSCRVSSAPDSIYSTSSAYIWKTPADLSPIFNFVDESPVVNVDQAVVAAQSATHGWGGCGLFQCYMGVEVITQVR